MYVLQLNPKAQNAWRFCVTWPGYWAGLGYVDSADKAVRFPAKRDAINAMSGIFVGMNGCLRIVKLRRKR